MRSSATIATAEEGDHRSRVPRDSRYRRGREREHERRQREHELQRQRVGEVVVDPLVVPGHLAHEDRVLSEAPERGDEGRDGQPEGEDPELALAELAGHDHVERKRCELRAEVGNGPVDRVGEDALGALAHRVKTADRPVGEYLVVVDIGVDPMSVATFYTISSAGYFPGTVALLNSLRLTGNAGELVVLDRGLLPDQRARLEPQARVVDLPVGAEGHPTLTKPVRAAVRAPWA